jgi:hypothetical protein
MLVFLVEHHPTVSCIRFLPNIRYGGMKDPAALQQQTKKATEYMLDAKNVGDKTFKEFMDYCKALDFCKVLVRVKNLEHIGYKTVSGYDPTGESWFKKCCKGILVLPEDSDMGNMVGGPLPIQ